jgi:hypothetical protein
MQHNACLVGSQRLDRRRYGLMPVANLHRRVHCPRWRRAHPVDTLNAKRCTEGGVSRPHHHRVVHWIEACHVQRLSGSDTEAASLPYGIKR